MADANFMHTNIDTYHTIEVISMWLDTLIIVLSEGFPLEATKAAMEIVMRNNLFEWGDKHFLQLLGTAMGTSASCVWIVIYFACHETMTLIPKYSRYLLIIKCFIYNMFGIWLDNGAPDACESFKADTNHCDILTWEFEEPLQSVDFLYLTIIIEINRILTKTYQKALNLYQYIMP